MRLKEKQQQQQQQGRKDSISGIIMMEPNAAAGLAQEIALIGLHAIFQSGNKRRYYKRYTRMERLET